MAAAAGVWSHHMAAGAALTGTTAALNSSAGAAAAAGSTAGAPTAAGNASGTTGSTGTGDNSSTISSNDFLTLLVTEMKNQDPTSDQDPNAYINQLVQVNSLEQLIDINQNLTTALGTPSSGTGTVGSAAAP